MASRAVLPAFCCRSGSSSGRGSDCVEAGLASVLPFIKPTESERPPCSAVSDSLCVSMRARSSFSKASVYIQFCVILVPYFLSLKPSLLGTCLKTHPNNPDNPNTTTNTSIDPFRGKHCPYFRLCPQALDLKKWPWDTLEGPHHVETQVDDPPNEGTIGICVFAFPLLRLLAPIMNSSPSFMAAGVGN